MVTTAPRLSKKGKLYSYILARMVAQSWAYMIPIESAFRGITEALSLDQESPPQVLSDTTCRNLEAEEASAQLLDSTSTPGPSLPRAGPVVEAWDSISGASFIPTHKNESIRVDHSNINTAHSPSDGTASVISRGFEEVHGNSDSKKRLKTDGMNHPGNLRVTFNVATEDEPVRISFVDIHTSNCEPRKFGGIPVDMEKGHGKKSTSVPTIDP
ncbi:hypothetical protein NHQ30_011086 [Ciborinia camelliae]|nr:hypothetical protein NHQ30_011086 [Ciborinia camelliae]